MTSPTEADVTLYCGNCGVRDGGKHDDKCFIGQRLRAETAERELTVVRTQLAERVIAPDRCPITGLRFFMAIDGIATYGGPHDSYSIPERDEDGAFFRRHYDHDAGGWDEEERVPSADHRGAREPVRDDRPRRSRRGREAEGGADEDQRHAQGLHPWRVRHRRGGGRRVRADTDDRVEHLKRRARGGAA